MEIDWIKLRRNLLRNFAIISITAMVLHCRGIERNKDKDPPASTQQQEILQKEQNK